MPNLTVEDFLSHFGVKGMKWGVRNERRRAIERAGREAGAAKRKELGIGRVTSGLRPSDYSKARQVNRAVREARRNAKKDIKLEELMKNPKHYHRLKVDMHNLATNNINVRLTMINSQPKYRKAINSGTLLNPNHPVTKQYHKDVQNAYVQELNSVASTVTNASATKTFKAVGGKNVGEFEIKLVDINPKVKHADASSFTVRMITNSEGVVTDFELVEDDLTQSAIDDILEHHGIKGMKWGVRRSRPSAVSVSDKRKKIKTSGGHGLPATESAVRARVIGQKAKKSGLKSLTDDELNTYARRIQMEQNVSRLMHNEKSRGAKFVDGLLGRQGSQLANKAAQEGGAKAARQIIKRSARVAALAAA